MTGVQTCALPIYGTVNNSNQTDVITNNQVASSNSLKPKKQRQIITEEMDESAKSIRDQSEYYYRVQIGAFKLKPTKIPFQNKLKNWQLLTDARGIYRIQVGIYKTKAEALNYQAELQSMGIPQSFVVKVSK